MVSKPWFEIPDEAEVKLRLKRGKKEVKKRLKRGKAEVKRGWRKMTSGRDFPRSYRDPPTRTYPSGTDPPEPLRPDLIWTRFRPDLDLKSPFSGPNQVEIGSKSGPGGGVRVGRCRAGGVGLGGGVPVAPPESL